MYFKMEYALCSEDSSDGYYEQFIPDNYPPPPHKVEFYEIVAELFYLRFIGPHTGNLGRRCEQ